MSSRCYGLSQGIAGQAFVGYRPAHFCGSVAHSMGYDLDLGPDPVDPDESVWDDEEVVTAIPPSPGPIYQGKEKPAIVSNVIKLAAIGTAAYLVYSIFK